MGCLEKFVFHHLYTKCFKFLEETSSWKEKKEIAEYNVDISLLFFCCKSLKLSSFIEDIFCSTLNKYFTHKSIGLIKSRYT